MTAAIDYREPARDALDKARLAIAEADPADVPLLWATVGTGYAAMAVAGAIMTTGTQANTMLREIRGELGKIRDELLDVNRGIR